MSESVLVRDVGAGTVREIETLGELHGQLEAEQVVPLREDGTPARVQELRGGFLIDGVPLNVALGEDWDPEQRAMLEPYYAAGQVPRPEGLAPLERPAPADPAPTALEPTTPAAKFGPLIAAGILGFFVGRSL